MKEKKLCPYCRKIGTGEVEILSSNENKLWKCPNCNKNVKFIKQTEKNLKSQLNNQIQLLINACESFDKGYEIEAMNIATKIRVLLHDTNNSTSLLTQLGKKDILFYNTALDYDSRNPFSHMGLIKILQKPDKDEFFAPLDAHQNIYSNNKKIDFKKWWDEIIVLEDSNKNFLTRKDLILAVCNKDGGAHIDEYLDEKYFNLTRDESVGWMYSNTNGEGHIMGAELASIRQIAHEVLKSIKDAFPEIFESNKLNIPKNEDKIQKEWIIEHPKIIITQDKDFKNSKKIDFKDSEVEININTLVYYLESSKTVDFWVNYIKSLGIDVGQAGLVDREIAMLKRVKINKIGELDTLLKKSKEWGERYLKGIFIAWGIDPDKLFIDRSHIINYFLIANFQSIFTDDVLEKEFRQGNPEIITVPAKIYSRP